MKKLAPLTLITAALVLAGCSSSSESAPEPAETTADASTEIQATRDLLEEDCEMEGAVNNCTEWLTDLVSSSYDAYKAAGKPEGEPTTRYDYINENSGEYARDLECPEAHSLDSSCVAMHVAIKSNVEMLIEELEAL